MNDRHRLLAHDGRDVFAGRVVATEGHHGERELGEADAGDFDTELGSGLAQRPGQEGNRGRSTQQLAASATIGARPSTMSCSRQPQLR